MKINHVILIGFLLFYPSIKGHFLNYDDDIHIYENEEIRALSFKTIGGIFSATIDDTYIPLTTLSFAFENEYLRLSPAIVHLNNNLFHLVNTYLVFIFALLMGLSLPAATIAAAVFCFHPLRVESVVWATERKDVLFTFFYLLSVISYMRYRVWGKSIFYILSLFLAALSILAKPMAVSLPAVILLIEWYKRWPIRIADKIPFALIIVPVGLITFILNNQVMRFKYLLIYIWCLTSYILNFIFPFNLHPFYSVPEPINICNSHYLLSFFVLSLMVYALIVMKGRLIRFAAAFFVMSIFFLLRGQKLCFDPIADRFSYLPTIGFCFLAGKYLSVVKKEYVYVLLAVLMLKTADLIPHWQTSQRFWDNVVTHNRTFPFPFITRGEYYYDEEEYHKAIADFTSALRFKMSREKKDDVYFYIARSNAYLNNFPDALRAILEISDLSSDVKYLSWAGYIKINVGDFTGAIENISEALSRDPNTWSDYRNRALAFEKIGMKNLAAIDIKTMKEKTPDVKIYKWGEKKLNELNQ